MNALKTILFFSCFILVRFLPAQPSEPADSLGWERLARVFMDQVDRIKLLPDSNIQLVKKAQAAFEKGGNQNEFINCYNHLSYFYFYKEDYDNAEKNAQAAKELAEEIQGKDHSNYTIAQGNQAVFLEKKGYYEKAIAVFAESIASIVLTNKTLSHASTLYANIAFCYISMGDFDQALLNLKNALRLRLEWKPEETGDPLFNKVEIAGIYSDMGKCYREKKLFDESISTCKKSLTLCEQAYGGGSDYLDQIAYNNYYNLAENYLEKEQADSVRYFIEKALDIAAQFEVSDDCYSFKVLGELFLKEGDFEKAIGHFDRAVQAAKKEAGSYKEFPQIAAMLTLKGKALLEMKDYNGALTTFQLGLESISKDFEARGIDRPPDLDRIIHKLYALDITKGKGDAFFYRYLNRSNDLEDLIRAEAHYKRAAEIIQKIRQSYITKGAKNQLASHALNVYEAAIEASLILYRESGDTSYLEQAFNFSESNKAIALMESINEGTAKIYAGLPDSLVEREKDLNIELAYVENKLSREKNKAGRADMKFIQDLEQKQFDLKNAIQLLIRKFENEYPKYYNFKYRPVHIALEEVRDRIPGHAVVVEYFIGASKAFVFFLTKKQLKVYPVSVTEDFAVRILRFYETISSPPASKNFNEGFLAFTSDALELYRLLLQEGLEHLPTNITQLIIIPDDLLGYLPFEAFLVAATGNNSMDYNPDHLHYLFEDYKLSYAYSCALLYRNTVAAQAKVPHDFIGFAPSFAGNSVMAERACTEGTLYHLSCNQKEVEMINALCPGEIHLGQAAGKQTFFEQAAQYKIIHLATHACVDNYNSAFNKIYFSDGYITNSDLYHLKLNAELVVLSACSTGAGELVKGEGIMSLARGFIHAGSESIMMSLWPVDDCATSDIMIRFYEQLKRGEQKDKALLLSKQDYFQSVTDKAGAHPYYWAPFIQYGNTAALDIDGSGFRTIVLAGMLILALVIFAGRYLLKQN